MDTPSRDVKERFSDRVADYVKYRPTYPRSVLSFLEYEFDFDTTKIVADIGSGTGIFSKILLENGNTVFAVEPNAEMRKAAESLLAAYPKFHSISGSGEETRLEPRSVDFITCAQAFHWLDPVKARAEFSRVLKPNGVAALIWNKRKSSGSLFLKEYEAIVSEFSVDYSEVKHTSEEKTAHIDLLFAPKSYKNFTCDNVQEFDFDGLKGRLLSSSYAPKENHPRFSALMVALRNLFEKQQRGGKVRIEYDTQVYANTLNG